jgi:chromate transporter
LILFNTYAGTMAAAPAGIVQGIAGGALATAVTFLPSFVLVLAGAPYVSRLYANPWLRRALSGITAAVIGLIASLAALLASAVLWTERGMNYETVIVAVLSLVILTMKRVPAPYLIALGAVVGILRWALIGT